jgi:hypothetical protein
MKEVKRHRSRQAGGWYGGTICHAEVHWYEAHGVGPKEFKIKRILEIQ